MIQRAGWVPSVWMPAGFMVDRFVHVMPRGILTWRMMSDQTTRAKIRGCGSQTDRRSVMEAPATQSTPS